MQTNTFMYPSINTKVWSELCYCCADAVFILEYMASISHCEIFFFIFMESRIMNASKCSWSLLLCLTLPFSGQGSQMQPMVHP